jgi:hypothetical protein
MQIRDGELELASELVMAELGRLEQHPPSRALLSYARSLRATAHRRAHGELVAALDEAIRDATR